MTHNVDVYIRHQRPLLLTELNWTYDMDIKELHALFHMECNFLFMSQLQRFN